MLLVQKASYKTAYVKIVWLYTQKKLEIYIKILSDFLS